MFDDELVTDEFGKVDVVVVVVVSLLFADNCRENCLVGGDRTCCCCFDVELPLVVVVEVDAAVLCETIAEYGRTGCVLVIVVVVVVAEGDVDEDSG